jgi:uncharacterized protein YjeT (DUF2065 family)
VFEDEIKMEERSSNVVPLLMALGLVVAIVGGLVYFIKEIKRNLTPQEAQQMVTQILQAQGPITLHFSTGMVEPSMVEKPFDPHYKLLAKAGLVKTGKPTYKGLEVTLTPEGKKMLAACGAKAKKSDGGGDSYDVPLATRKLVRVTNIEMLSPGLAKVEYEWNWDPTPLGLVFDIKSPDMAGMSQWESATLIQKYGADFYKDSDPKKVTIRVIWDANAKAWKLFHGD